jgi:ABC-2 type transport system permease protein
MIVSAVVILAIINLFSSRHFHRFDLTSNKEYTLAKSSKRIVGGLKDLLTIKAYFSEKLPPYLVNLKRQVEDLLEEYQAYAKGNLRVEFIDPGDNPQLARTLQFQGIPQVQLNILEHDKYQVMNAYLGMSIEYEDRREVIPAVLPRNVGNLEYDLTSAIIKVISAQVRPIGLLTNNPSVNLKNDYRQISDALERQYSVRQIDLTQTNTIPRQLGALIIFSPQDFTDRQLYELDQFFMNGGKLICLVDTVELEQGALNASVKVPNITKLLEHYGVSVHDDLVADLRSHSMASFNTGFVSFALPYPFFIKITREGLAKDSPIVNRLESLVLPWASSLDVNKTAEEGVEVTRLASTTPYALSQHAPFDLNPQQRFRPKKEDLEQRLMAVMLKGTFPSYFKDKPVPEETPEPEPTPARPRPEEPKTITESSETELLVVGTSRFISDRQLYQFASNMIFMQNAVDWMALGEDLIGIRTREATERPLRELSDGQKTTVRYLDTFGASVLVVLFGLTRIVLKRRKRIYYKTILVD